MENRLGGVIEALQSEESTLLATIAKQKQELAAAEAELRQIRGALKELGVKSKPGKPKSSNNPSKADVSRVIAEVLAADGVMEVGQLKQVVASRLRDQGFTQMGYALRFKEVLKSDRFLDSPGGIRINPEVDDAHTKQELEQVEANM